MLVIRTYKSSWEGAIVGGVLSALFSLIFISDLERVLHEEHYLQFTIGFILVLFVLTSFPSFFNQVVISGDLLVSKSLLRKSKIQISSIRNIRLVAYGRNTTALQVDYLGPADTLRKIMILNCFNKMVLANLLTDLWESNPIIKVDSELAWFVENVNEAIASGSDVRHIPYDRPEILPAEFSKYGWLAFLLFAVPVTLIIIMFANGYL